MNSPAIHIENLRVAAGSRTILSIGHLSVARGEVLAVLGLNGAGKSTLLNVCLGLRRFSSGEVVVLGEPVGRSGSASLARLRCRIGYAPQTVARRSQAPLTIREVVAIGRTGLAGLLSPLRGDDWRIIDEWLERVGLERIAGQAYSDASGGEQRRTLIARVMVQQPEMLLLDEPTANLDLSGREQIVATLQKLHEETRVTIVLVCHELEVIPPCCGSLLVLEHGNVIAEGRPETALTDGVVAALYGRGLIVVHGEGRHSVIPEGARR